MIAVQTTEGRIAVPSLAPYLRRSLDLGMVMDPARMERGDVATCRWIGHGIGKGVTSTRQDLTIFGIPSELKSGFHAELIRDFERVDPFPLCYDMLGHIYGFGTFIRWVHFADPAGGPGVLGVDWSLSARKTAGVANGMTTAARIFSTAMRHGIPAHAEGALLNWRMCEDPVITAWREDTGLRTIADWCTHGPLLFAPWQERCPRCGLRTITATTQFCTQCGCKPDLWWPKAA